MAPNIPSEYTKKGVVLIVDDNPANLVLLYEYLTRTGFELLLAQTGDDALDQAIHLHPDIILLDIMMPGLDGFETCEQLKAHEATRDIPVIFVTALTNTTDKIKGFQVGGVDYVTKPFQPEEVGARIHTHLMLRRLQHQLETQNTILQEQKEALSHLNTSKDKFFSIIAHDLRTPLTAFLAYTRYAAECLDALTHDELREMVDHLRNTSESLYELLENLLHWSRIQRGLMVYMPQQINIQEVLLENLALLRANAAQKQITFHNKITEKFIAYADKQVVDLVFRNLLSNAVKFTPTQGTIDILAEDNGEHLAVSVADTGRGIAPADLVKLFRFDQLYSDAGTSGERGTGLGLLLCKELLEGMGGEIHAASEPGKGSTFTFTLPKTMHAEVSL